MDAPDDIVMHVSQDEEIGEPATKRLKSETSKKEETNVPTLQELSKMVQDLQNGGNPNVTLTTMKSLKELLCAGTNPPIDQVVEAGAIPVFVHFLKSEGEKLQLESACALTNLIAGVTKHTSAVVDAGAVPVLVKLLNSENEEIRTQAVRTLGNIAGYSPRYRNLVLNCGALPELLKIFEPSYKISEHRNAARALANFCRGKPVLSLETVAPVLPVLAKLILSPETDIVTEACWALSHLSDGANDRIQAILDLGITNYLVDLLLHPDRGVQVPALKIMDNLTTGNYSQTKVLINAGVIENLSNLLLIEKKQKDFHKDIIFAISNITAGSFDQIQAVIDAGLIPQLVQDFKSPMQEVRKECMWAIANATLGRDAQVAYLVREGCVRILCAATSESDHGTVANALDGLHWILIKGENDDEPNKYLLEFDAEALDQITKLMSHDIADISDKAAQIMEFFGTDEHA